jgi:hypothetical protein
MFKNKGVNTIEKQAMVKPKVPNLLVHLVDVNMAITKNKVTKEQVFKDISRRNVLLIGKRNKNYNNFL